MKHLWKWMLVIVVFCNVGISPGQTANKLSKQQLQNLRAQGPEGLNKLITQYQAELDKSTFAPPTHDPQWQQLCAALDFVGGQKDNYASRLYWFTDIQQAEVFSAKEHKPILSLRLLGKLTDELSCANSRFFRTALYPNTKINKLLRDHFVLYWSSERPVPVVTIDMGDGRTIKRTLTGNSAHYLLSSDGTPLDVLPGLNAPGAFARWLESSLELYQQYEATPQNERDVFLADYHAKALEKSILAINPNAAKQMEPTIESVKQKNPLLAESPSRVSAVVAAPLPVTKRGVEMPLLNATKLMTGSALDGEISFGGNYPQRAARYANDARLDKNSLALLKAKHPRLESAGKQSTVSPLSTIDFVLINPNSQFTSPFGALYNSPYLNGSVRFGKNGKILQPKQEAPIDRLIQNFERAMALDTARNDSLHVAIHALFAENKQGNFEELNRKIYDRLFLTPASDAWLGLDTPGIYTAIDNAGIIAP